ncbi:maltokinase N-terminal cap-like domain-containing protein [uncultured Microbacterium sp.]|uniref:maltokinase N-terminal cap-like domain-containing protein n=1 Tax=uncultured Microbacterium sp. TaxID=191216 RepID=UPI0028DD2107|nr:phosphotransferase [uncultured Microbacterium sp.]
MNLIENAILEDYLVRTRWFGGKSRPFHVPAVRRIADLSATDGRVQAIVFLVTVEYDDPEGGSETYQVPLASYDEPQEAISHAAIGSVEDEGRVRHLYDAVHDRYAMALWLEGLVAAEASETDERGGLRFRRVPGTEALDPALRSSPLAGEQSNSSVRFDDTAIMKVFRKVTPGLNPDIEIHRELTRAGAEHIAVLYGWVEADVDGEVVQLAMVQEFLRTATDGFDLATGSVRTLLADPEQSIEGSGGDFAGEAARLGTAVAEVHATLRERFPVDRRGPRAAASLARTMADRLEHALGVVPELAPHADRLRAAYAAVAQLPGLDVQRVHGDLHLGQTLRTAHGWRIVDFEGEPGRPFAERALPDSPWRDVAGMLRSFDYVPGVVEMAQASSTEPVEDAEDDLRIQRGREWAERARGCFLDAYIEAMRGADDEDSDSVDDGGAHLSEGERTLLNAYVADKAVYEAVYEKRNRPGWVSIPLQALGEI